MKTKLATALSLVGVLGAGSAAALVNTQILDSGPTESGASAAVLPPPSSVDLTVPTIPIDALTDAPTDTFTTTTLAPATSATSTTEPSSTSTTVAPVASGMLTAFNVGDAGVVTVDVIDGRLVLVAAEPKPGWELTEAHDGRDDRDDDLDDDDSDDPDDDDSDDPDDDDSDDGDESEVEVEFRSATVRVEFEASLVDGQIVPRVESKAIGGTTPRPGAATSNTVPSNTIDDDDRDDDRDEDERDDDDRDDDHEDEPDDDDHEDEPDDDDHDNDHEDEPDDD